MLQRERGTRRCVVLDPIKVEQGITYTVDFMNTVAGGGKGIGLKDVNSYRRALHVALKSKI